MTEGGRLYNSAGITIVEVLIVLAISSAMLFSAIALISGRQDRTEFTTGMDGVRQQLQQIINETQSGYFPNTGGFTCMAPIDEPAEFSGPVGGGLQGSNQGCIFLGKGIQFGTDSTGANETQMATIPIVGRQYTPTSNTALIATLKDALPRPATPQPTDPMESPLNAGAVSSVTGLTTTLTLPYGIHIAKSNAQCHTAPVPSPDTMSPGLATLTPAPVCINTSYNAASPSWIGTGMLLFLAGDSSGTITSSTAGTLNSGAQQLSLYGVGPNSAIGGYSSWVGDSANAAGKNVGIVAGRSYPGGSQGNLKNASQALVCFADDATNQSALFSIDGTGSLSVSLTIKYDTTCA